MRKTAAGLILVVALAAMFTASAFATGSSPTTSVYQNGGVSIQKSLGTLKPPSTPTPAPTNNTVNTTAHNSTPSGVAGAATSKPATQLPFTGLDLGLFVAGGLILLAMGFGLRRLSRKPPVA